VQFAKRGETVFGSFISNLFDNAKFSVLIILVQNVRVMPIQGEFNFSIDRQAGN
jgi:hypothetical protein